MNSQNNEDSINFSVIDKPDDPAPALDFSLPELLEEQNLQTKPNKEPPSSLQMSVEQVFRKIKKMNVQSGRSIVQEGNKCNSFLDALERIEKELSFQTESYNIYDQNPNFQTEIIQNNKSKTLSCLKMTKETNKSSNPSAQQQHSSFNDYFGPLIIDFRKKEHNEKEKKQHKSNKNKSKNGSQISIDRSDKLKAKERINSKSRSKEMFRILGLKEKSKSKPYLLPLDFKKSKNNPNLARRSVSKSQGNLNTNTQGQLQAQAQADAYASKVFTEYYGTDVDFKHSLGEMKQKKQQRLAINNIKYSQKSKSKVKLGLFTPKGKAPQTIAKK